MPRIESWHEAHFKTHGKDINLLAKIYLPKYGFGGSPLGRILRILSSSASMSYKQAEIFGTGDSDNRGRLWRLLLPFFCEVASWNQGGRLNLLFYHQHGNYQAVCSNQTKLRRRKLLSVLFQGSHST